MIVETKLYGALEIAAGLNRVARFIKTGSSTQIGRKLTSEGLRVVVKLTPRQKHLQREGSTKRGYEPFYKQWRVIQEVQTQSSYRAIIRNRATGTPAGMAALASVEFGASAHTIVPKHAQQLVWFQPGSQRLFGFRSSPATRTKADPELKVTDFFRRRRQDEGHVFAFEVHHPGHRSFRMVQETKDHLNRLARTLLVQFSKSIEQEFGAGFKIRVT